ncbi:MAG: hypothetical protein BGO55_04520 [Sphingobacteriales bacterium 50-39]|nr:MAG: hypothetical protein BGO55_04520 [Sphingobacteriales bacterium 50-39]
MFYGVTVPEDLYFGVCHLPGLNSSIVRRYIQWHCTKVLRLCLAAGLGLNNRQIEGTFSRLLKNEKAATDVTGMQKKHNN